MFVVIEFRCSAAVHRARGARRWQHFQVSTFVFIAKPISICMHEPIAAVIARHKAEPICACAGSYLSVVDTTHALLVCKQREDALLHVILKARLVLLKALLFALAPPCNGLCKAAGARFADCTF